MCLLDMEVEIGKLKLKNPVMPASGTFGYGVEYAKFYDPAELGAIVVKGTTLQPTCGNQHPRIAETPSGLLNAIGLENVGLDSLVGEVLPTIASINAPVIVNISGNSIEEYERITASLDKCVRVDAIEVNISCPNVKKGGLAFGTSPETAAEVTKAVRKETAKTVIVKLSPNVTDIGEIAAAVEKAGADAVSLINTLLGMSIDIEKRRPKLANITGGLSGPAVKPIAVRMVWQTAKRIGIPIIGMGGISCAEDAIEFILAGASAIAVGTANFVNPCVMPEIIEGIRKYMMECGYSSLKEITGIVK